MAKNIVFEVKVHKTTDNKRLSKGETRSYDYGTINIRSPALAKHIGKSATVEVQLKNEGKYGSEENKTSREKSFFMGLEEVKSFGSSLNSWKNRLIYGDNLAMLHELSNDAGIMGKVKLIYIDPPFSTNREFRGGGSRTATMSPSSSDEIAYTDNLRDAEYLDFLRKRLFLLKDFLADDGSIYVHIDYKVGHYVKILMDEVFGKSNFVNEITRIKSNPKNFQRKAYGNIKDMILFYSKTKDYVWNDPREDFTDESIGRLFSKTDKQGRKYTTNPLHAPGETKNGETGKLWKGLLPPKGRHWRYKPQELDRLDKNGLIEWSSNGVPRKIIYADDYIRKGMKKQDIWEFKDPQYPSYPTEKNFDMLKLIIGASSDRGNIVMDAFCGSGTTLIASEELGRKWIGIDSSQLAIKATMQKLLKLKSCSKWGLYELEKERLPDAVQEILQQ